MLDYLVIGLGLAGISFCEQLEQYGKSYRVISDHSQTSSSVAGGIYHPVVLKRFSLVWEAEKQLRVALPYYTALERKLGIPLNYKTPILRRFESVDEQNQWDEARNNPSLQSMLAPRNPTHQNKHLYAPYGYGELMGMGRIDTNSLLKSYANYLHQKGRLLKATLDHKRLHIAPDSFTYGSLKARHLVFTTGFGLKENPWFNYLPLTGNKGEYLIIRSPDLQEQHIIKGSIFCIPMGGNLYRIGATYDREDKTPHPTTRAKTELQLKLGEFLTCGYTIEDQVAGIRPTVADHQLLAGTHPEIARMYLLNGLGSRGVMMAPFAAKFLYEHIAFDRLIPPEINLARFEGKWRKIRG